MISTEADNARPKRRDTFSHLIGAYQVRVLEYHNAINI